MTIKNTPTKEQLASRMKEFPDDFLKQCPACKQTSFALQLGEFEVCPHCHYGYRITAYRRVALLTDEFVEIDHEISAPERFDNPKYQAKLAQAKAKTHLNESVLTGVATINGHQVALGVMDPFFIMGSLGSATGKKITNLFDLATKKGLPVVIITASGGARMQEGIHSLMQMAKVSEAVSRHDQAGLLYITVLSDPTTGGVTASFAMQADVILAEPHAIVGFAGKRVIEQTIHEKTPDEFQRAETVLQNGFIDAIVRRESLKETLTQIIDFHKGVDES